MDLPYRGFAYEGAAMAYTILDAFRSGRESRIDRFLAGRGSRHVYTVHIGVGWGSAVVAAVVVLVETRGRRLEEIAVSERARTRS